MLRWPFEWCEPYTLVKNLVRWCAMRENVGGENGERPLRAMTRLCEALDFESLRP